jgi:hypothetical protein
MTLQLGHCESRSEIYRNFSYVVLEKAGDDHLDRSCEMRRVKRGKGQPIFCKTGEGQMGWSLLV